MRKIIGLLSFVIIAFILSCQNNNTEPNYSIIPYIELRDFRFIKGNLSAYIADTLKLTFYLRDGDFDLGLNSTAPPYNPYFFLNKTNGELMAAEDIPADHSNLVTYADRKAIDTLPSLNCSRWTRVYSSNPAPKVTDTIYYQKNPNARNIFVDIYSQDDTQVWSYFDPNERFSFPNCASDITNGTFPELPFNSNGLVFRYKSISSKEGLMTFSIISFSWHFIFNGKKVKSNLHIQDRALHKSNVVETPSIQF